MFRFLIKLWQSIKSWFRRNTSSSPPPSPKPELSDLEYENLLLELLEQVLQGSSWGQLQGFLMANKLEPDKLARWLNNFGKSWLLQPESHGELADRLLLLSRLATGELGEVARELGENLSNVKAYEEEEEENFAVNSNASLLTNPHSSDDQAIKLKLDDYQAWLNRGNTLSNLERYEEALASFDQAIKLKPDDYQAWSKRGHAAYYLRWW